MGLGSVLICISINYAIEGQNGAGALLTYADTCLRGIKILRIPGTRVNIPLAIIRNTVRSDTLNISAAFLKVIASGWLSLTK